MAHPALASNDPMKAVARGTSQRLLRAALEATLLVLVAPVAPAAQPPTPTVWFAPLDPMFRPWAGYGGSIDYLDLFSASAPWATAAAHVQVFKIYATLVDYLTDDQLRRMFADLDRRNIALAVEFGPLVPENCGFGIEGFNGEDALQLATRIQQTGGTLRYIARDEPYYFARIYSGNNACRWSAWQSERARYPPWRPDRGAGASHGRPRSCSLRGWASGQGVITFSGLAIRAKPMRRW